MDRSKLSLLIAAYLLVIFFIAAALPGAGGQSPTSDGSLHTGESDACSRNGDNRRIGGPPAVYTSAAGPPVEAEAKAGDDVEEKGKGAKGSSSPPGRTVPMVYPLPASSIYTYEQMTSRLHSLKGAYPDLIKLGSVGSSVEGRNLWSLSMGKGDQRILIVGACHAREWLTSALLVKTIETYAQAYGSGGTVGGYPVREVLDQYTMLFVPMQNPDGVTLAQHGLAAFPEDKHDQLLAMKPGKSDNFTRWKANIRGVDLNRQHSAGPQGWEKHKNAPKTPRKPWFEEYPGLSPESEPESKAIAGLIRQGNFEAILTYHSTGNRFFWYFFFFLHGSKIMERDQKIVQAMSNYSGYQAYPSRWVTWDSPSHLTAWVVYNLKIPCITVEIGKYTTGYLNMSDLKTIWPKTRALPLVTAQNLPGYRTHFTITCRVSPEQGGEVTGGGEVQYRYGTEVKVSARPQTHYDFVNWTENGDILGTDPDLAVRVTADRILSANFKLREYTITASAGDGGCVEGSGFYIYGSEVTLKAIPDEGYRFSGWTEYGAHVCDTAIYTFPVEGNRDLIACFEMISE